MTLKTPGVHVFYAPNDATTGEWVYQRVEDGFGMNGCVGADITNDVVKKFDASVKAAPPAATPKPQGR